MAIELFELEKPTTREDYLTVPALRSMVNSAVSICLSAGHLMEGYTWSWRLPEHTGIGWPFKMRFEQLESLLPLIELTGSIPVHLQLEQVIVRGAVHAIH